MEGTIKLATVAKKRTLEPQNLYLNANPAATDKITVNTITITPKIIDLLNAEPISTTEPPRHNSSNQYVETPLRGKVKPPSGPWKLKSTIVKVGPYRNKTNREKKKTQM